MSPAQRSRNSDLQRLRDEGYEISVTALGHLIIDHVPYVNGQRQVLRAKLVSKLIMASAGTANPVLDPVVFWTGQPPCDQEGTPLLDMVTPGQTLLEPDLAAECSFSCKPAAPYPDYYAKMTTYVAMISGPAEVIDQTATARTYRITEDEDPEYPFVYPDTASSRAGIAVLTDRLRGQRIAIVGLGGTGSYILDLVAKTPVKEIHLFDGDDFLSHNAFRAPGAASLVELNTRPKKVARLHTLYSVMKKGIEPHEYGITAANVEEIRGLDFVFLSMEGGLVKRIIVDRLTKWGTPFIDVGLGIKNTSEALTGVLRVTTSTPAQRDHVQNRIDFSDPMPEDPYDQNIQIGDLNALNAALAVIKWKKLMGVYTDLENEHFAAYTLDGNHMVNEDKPCT